MTGFAKSSAHLRTMREAAGLTLQAAADLAGVSLRTWQYWEAPESDQPIKTDVYALLADLIERKDLMVSTIIDTVTELEAEFDIGDEDGAVMVITRYRSQEHLDQVHPGFPGGIGLHNAALAAALDALGEQLLVQWAPTDEEIR